MLKYVCTKINLLKFLNVKILRFNKDFEYISNFKNDLIVGEGYECQVKVLHLTFVVETHLFI